MSTVLEPLSKQARYSRKKTAENAEIGPPPITDEQRSEGRRLWELCKDSLENFNTLVFPNSTGLKPFGQVQKTSIAHDESVIRDGGRICKAEPRAYGKTSRTCNAGMWATLYEYRRMIPVFSANMEKSKSQIMARWKAEILSNNLLFWMFPELIWPLRALENRPQRCQTQTFNGVPTYTQWTADRIVFPHAPGVPGSGSALIALPLKSCRGATHTTPDGEILRPDLAIFDDVQKDEDADNPNTIHKLEELIDHTALMLGGHSQSMSAIMNCTVRRADDLSEKYLKKTSWRRVRYKMLTSPAKLEKEFWLGEYADVRNSYDPEDPDDQRRAQVESLKLYESKRAGADEGAEVTWDWAYTWADAEPTEISAIQHAYNIRIDLGESVFASECQNEPVRESGGLKILTVDEICKKQSSYERGQVPAECTVVVGMVDVHPEILYWHEWAMAPGFNAYLIDYGTFPDQRRRHFNHKMLARSLRELFPGMDTAATINAGIDALLHGYENDHWPGLMRRERIRADGVPMKVAHCFADANGEESDAVKNALRRSEFAASLTPSFGKYVGAKHKPISQWQNAKGVDAGPEWLPTQAKAGQLQGVIFDTNYWKTRFHRGLALAAGSKGAIYLYKHRDPDHHRMLAEHFRAEKPTEVTVGSRTVYEFGEPGPGQDNHFFDCGVGSMVAASKMKISNVPPRPSRTVTKSAAEYKAEARKRA